MPEGGNNIESFSGAPQGSEKTQESQEKFSERYRQNQAAIKKGKKDEKKKHDQDESLAAIIVQFLHQTGHTALFLLISRLVARNIPSDLILAIISLIYHPAAKVIQDKMLALPAVKENPTEEKGLFSPEVKRQIDSWTNSIAAIARAEARRILQTAYEPDSAPNAGLIQLFALVLREFLEKEKAESIEITPLHHFGEAFFSKVFRDLEDIVGKEYLLKS